MQSTKSLKVTVFILLLVVVVILSGCGGTAPPINHSPTIISLTAEPSSPIEINQDATITCYATDQDGNTLTYNWTKTGGTISVSESGSTIIWTAPATTGTYTITCTVSDGESSDTESFNITVSEPPNQAPVITSVPVTSVILGETYTYTVEAADPDGDDLTYSLLTGSPSDMSIDENSGVITWFPTATGDFDVTVEVSDGSESATQSFTITVDKVLLVSIEVLPSAMAIEIGESEEIISVTAYYNDNTDVDIALDACTYESDKPSVATVSPYGVVTGVSSCSASTPVTITVSYTEDSIPVTDTVSVVVINPSPG